MKPACPFSIACLITSFLVCSTIGAGTQALATCDDNDASFQYIGNEWDGNIWSGQRPQPLQGTNHGSPLPGDSVNFTFTGTDVYIYGFKGKDHGRNSYSFGDGQAPVTCDGSKGDQGGRALLFSRTGMENTAHTLAISNTGKEGQYLNIDYAQVRGSCGTGSPSSSGFFSPTSPPTPSTSSNARTPVPASNLSEQSKLKYIIVGSSVGGAVVILLLLLLLWKIRQRRQRQRESEKWLNESKGLTFLPNPSVMSPMSRPSSTYSSRNPSNTNSPPLEESPAPLTYSYISPFPPPALEPQYIPSHRLPPFSTQGAGAPWPADSNTSSRPPERTSL